jgi:hypothetical protein
VVDVDSFDPLALAEAFPADPFRSGARVSTG